MTITLTDYSFALPDTVAPGVTAIRIVNQGEQMHHAILSRIDSARFDTLHLAYANFKRRPRRSEIKQLEDWLRARVKTEKLRLVVN